MMTSRSLGTPRLALQRQERRLASVLLLALGGWLPVVGCATPPAPEERSIEGRVADSAGEPIAGVSVTLDGPGGVSQQMTVTGQDGRYSFEGVPEGSNTVSIVTPQGHTCDMTSVTLFMGPTDMLVHNFTCDRFVPFIGDLVGPWVFNYDPFSDDCTPGFPPFDVEAIIEAPAVDMLDVVFPDAPAPISGTYNIATGEFNGATGQVDLGGGLSANEVWDAEFLRDLIGGVNFSMDGISTTTFTLADGSTCAILYNLGGFPGTLPPGERADPRRWRIDH